jgi:hypothetical protein
VLTLDYDPQSKIVKGVSFGFLTVEDARSYGQRLAQLTRQVRDENGFVRLYLDSRESAIQPKEVMAAFAEQPSVIKDSRDRVAVVVSSSRSKLTLANGLPNSTGRAR